MNSMNLIRIANRVGGRLAPGLTARVARRMLMTPRRLPTRPWEQAAINAGERFTLQNGLSAISWGSKGPVVLCLHGWEGRASQFACFAPRLVEIGYRVIAVDAPAHGRSPGKEANPLVFMQGLLEAGKELGPLAMVIGHSMGAGAAALAISRGLNVRAAVLIAGPSGLRGVLQRFAGFVGLPAAARERFFSIVEEHTGAPLETVEISQLASDFRIPGLIIHDQDDVMMPFAEAQENARYWPGAKLFATKGLGHNRILRDAEVVSTVVSFARFAIPYRRAA